jgi:hypothetical protein
VWDWRRHDWRASNVADERAAHHCSDRDAEAHAH